MSPTKVTEPPSWFRLENYEVCESMSLLQWARALNVRRVVSRLLLGESDSFEGLAIDHLGALIKWCSIDVAQTSWKQLPNEILRTMSFTPWGTVSPVSSMDLSMHQKRYRLLQENGVVPIEDDSSFFNPVELNYPAKVFRDRVGKVFARINIMAPEAVILDDFKKFIQEYKQSLGIEGIADKYDESDCRKWHELKILPYLDLLSWLMNTGQKMTNSKIGNILFPDEFDIDLSERIRKVTKPLAKNLVTHQTINALLI